MWLRRYPSFIATKLASVSIPDYDSLDRYWTYVEDFFPL